MALHFIWNLELKTFMCAVALAAGSLSFQRKRKTWHEQRQSRLTMYSQQRARLAEMRLPRIAKTHNWDQAEILNFQKIGFFPELETKNGITMVRYLNSVGLDKTDHVEQIFGEQFADVNYKVLCELELMRELGDGLFQKLHGS
jgi:hypothetical protein